MKKTSLPHLSLCDYSLQHGESHVYIHVCSSKDFRQIEVNTNDMFNFFFTQF